MNTPDQPEVTVDIDLRYTLCFGIDGDRVLMLHRHKQPNQHLWNGLGGKIEPGEAPDLSIQREVYEEAGLQLPLEAFRFGGIVTWPSDHAPNGCGGMYIFVADMTGLGEVVKLEDTREGRLEWKSLAWVCSRSNFEVVDNIPYFLPKLLEDSTAVHFKCQYDNHIFAGLEVRELPTRFLI